MKRDYIYRSIAGLTTLLSSLASMAGAGVSDGLVREASMVRNGDLMTIGLTLHPSQLQVKSTRASVLVPMIVNGGDTLALPGVGVYGRTRWFQLERAGDRPLSGGDELALRYKNDMADVAYAQHVAYADWMNGAELVVKRTDYGCAGCQDGPLLSEDLARYRMVNYEPVFRYQAAVAEKMKLRELAGRAYIDFPVNRTELYPDYRKNPTELAKIIATIDSVRNDKDVTVRRITIKGWASPESPWENNTRLAKGRTATLKQYVQNLYHFPEGFIETDYYPEDWIGLRAFVETSNLPHRQEILALIDDDTLAPDPKEDKLKKTYPEEYKFLLATVYPGLRHSDYTIEYTIRQFSDPAEIRELLRTAPQKLSLNEIYLLVESLEPGSPEYNDVFETAVRLFPEDATANLNAANAAMQRNDLSSAARYLDKAGDSAEAVYARGVLSALQGDYDKALETMEQAARKGMDTTAMREHLMEVKKYR